MSGHRFTKVLFAVEHSGTALGVALKAADLEKLLAQAASLSPGGALELYPMPNQALFELAIQPHPKHQGTRITDETATELLSAILALPEAQACLHKLRSGQGTNTPSAVWLRAETLVNSVRKTPAESDAELIQALAGDESFGAVRIQRLMGLNYFKAASKLEQLAAEGLIHAVDGDPFKFTVKIAQI